MGDDDAEQPNGGGGHFPVGSVVEVQYNEKDFGGVYFSATVVPPPISLRKSNTEKTGERLYVKYHNLLAREEGTDRLREYVDVSSVRPTPPQHKTARRFEPNDFVDAFYMDGWWKGVVNRVVGGGERFVVTFENPPDELEFGSSALRPHWEWVDGVWAGPQKQGEVANDLALQVGAKVEISFERDDDEFKGAWFPGAIGRDLGNGTYLVEFKDKNGGCDKDEVGSVHIRPCPPILKDRKFGTFEKVDAFFDFGWWSGLIRKKVKKNGYIVFFEHMNLNKLFNQSELRPHMDWRDDKWFICGVSRPPPSPLTSSSRKRRKWSLSDSGAALKKHKPQNQHAKNQENEMMVVENDERNSKRIEDIQTPSIFDEDYSITPNSAASLIESLQQRLPFVKRNAVWKAVESMEVLRRLPQRPHFEPLLRFKESQREGLAIACMVSFSNAVEMSCSLKFSDPKSLVDDLQETLEELETHGFEVGVVKERVMELAAAKEEEERLVDQARKIKDEIEERGWKRSKIEGEMRVINGHIGRLQEQLELAEIAKAKEVEDIAHLQAGLEETQQEMESLRCGFERVAASVINCDR